MKNLLLILTAFAALWPAAARAADQAALDSPFVVSSYHWTTSDGIQSWGAISLLSPSGQWYEEGTHFGLDRPDGSSQLTVTLNEVGIWQVWHGFGFGAPQSSSTYYQPNNFIQVGPTNNAPAVSWTSSPASATAGQNYTISAHGHDDDGNLTQVQIWKNGQPFAFAGGGDGTDGDSGNTTSDGGPQTITFTAQATDASGATSAVITHVITVAAAVNQPPVVTLLSPGSQTVTAGTALVLSYRATDPDGNLVSHNLDIQRPAGDWNFQGGFAAGEPFQGGPVGSPADSTRTASFTFSDVGTYYVRSAANDGSGWSQSATVAITVVAPPPLQYALVTSAGAGGSVSPGGTFTAGTSATVSATPDATHDFAGWSGDAGGAVNPLGVLMDRNKTVQANFALKSFILTTSAMSGGSATPGGSYPYGTTVTLSAAPDAVHYFTGWTGDASGTVPSVAVLVDRAKFVQAQFAAKAPQSIAFTLPGNQSVGALLTLAATASSGLPVSFVVVSGPAVLTGNQLQVTGPGAITLRALQAGDGYTLPAPIVTGSFNAAGAAVLKYQAASRTYLQNGRLAEAANYILGNP